MSSSDAEAIDQWRLWVYRFEHNRLAGRSHVQDRLTAAVLRKLEADLLDPSHRGPAAVAAYEAVRQAAQEFVQSSL